MAILDADKEGFLRSEGSLIQTIGRAARNLQGKAILYADVRTGSIERAIAETDRRRNKQIEYNVEHGITPRSIVKAVADVMEGARVVQDGERYGSGGDVALLAPEQAVKRIKKLEAEMMKLARNLEFEQAARVRDEIQKLRAFGIWLAEHVGQGRRGLWQWKTVNRKRCDLDKTDRLPILEGVIFDEDVADDAVRMDHTAVLPTPRCARAVRSANSFVPPRSICRRSPRACARSRSALRARMPNMRR